MCDLKTFRKTNNLTQSDIADFLGGGVGKVFISQIEHGNRKLPSAQLAKLLNNPYGWDTSALSGSTITARASGTSKLLGHTSVKTTEIYAHIVDEKKRAAVDNIPKL